jgi:hypothetical protein
MICFQSRSIAQKFSVCQITATLMKAYNTRVMRYLMILIASLIDDLMANIMRSFVKPRGVISARITVTVGRSVSPSCQR